MTRLAVFVAMLLTAGAGPAQAAGPRGLRYGPVVASLPARAGVYTSIDTVRRDAAGDLLVTAQQRIATFHPDGRLRAEWTVPGATGPTDSIVADVTADGRVYAAMRFSDVVRVYDLDGTELATFGGPGQLRSIDQVVMDPRGSVLVTDMAPYGLPPEYRLLRFGLDGTPLGPVPGGPIAPALTVASDGSRWAARYDRLVGVDAAGRVKAFIGHSCDMRIDADECAHDTGRVVSATDLAVDDRGRVVAVEPSDASLQLYGVSGRLRLTCFPADPRIVVGAAEPVPGGLLVGHGLTVQQATWTTKPTKACRSSRMHLTRVRARRLGDDGRTWRLSYRLSARGRAWVEVFRQRSGPCGTEAANSFDPHGTCSGLASTYRGKRIPAAGGLNTARLRLPSGSWQIQVSAVNRFSEGVEAPLIKLRTTVRR